MFRGREETQTTNRHTIQQKLRKRQTKGEREKEKAVDAVVLWQTTSHILSFWQSLGTLVAIPLLAASEGPRQPTEV